LLITEIFGPTLQGEGQKIGTPSIFIRFGGCNLSCSGFGVEYKSNNTIKKGCDSYYSVDKAYKDDWQDLSADEIITKVKSLSENIKEIVITGGEPLLWWKKDEFQKLLRLLHSYGYKITIETNSTILINFEHNYQKDILFSMSVKLSNSGEKLEKRVNEKAIANIVNSVKHYFKFVVDSKKSVSEIKNIIEFYNESLVYIMPLGATIDEIENIRENIVSIALENGFVYSDRLHIRFWNKKRGV
jgi:7-carboxy-7-deazaguanine synthase